MRDPSELQEREGDEVWIFPMGAERKAFQQAVDGDPSAWVRQPERAWPIYSHRSRRWTLLEAGQGKVQAALACQHAYQAYRPAFLWLCGTATALDAQLASGSWLLCSLCLETDFGGIGDKKLKDEVDGAKRLIHGKPICPSFPTPDSDLREADRRLALNELPDDSAPWLRGACLSADRDLLTPADKAAWHRRFGAFAGAWEGAGLARFRNSTKAPCMELRLIVEGAGEAALPWQEFHRRMAAGFAVLAERLS